MSFSVTVIGLLFVVCVTLVASIVIWSTRSGIAPMPTSPQAKKVLLRLLPPGLSGAVFELGVGWGTLLIPLAQRYGHLTIFGYELSPVPYWFTRCRLFLGAAKNVRLKRQDFFQADFRKAELIVCYLYPGAMQRLKEKFEKELQPGTWVVSNTFAVPGWRPQQVAEVGDLYHTKVYVYRFGNQ